jgi:hypothetical protein
LPLLFAFVVCLCCLQKTVPDTFVVFGIVTAQEASPHTAVDAVNDLNLTFSQHFTTIYSRHGSSPLLNQQLDCCECPRIFKVDGPFVPMYLLQELSFGRINWMAPFLSPLHSSVPSANPNEG